MFSHARFLTRLAIVGAVLAAVGAPSAIAQPAYQRGVTRQQPGQSAIAGTPADEALEYVSLGKAVEHAARQQREDASRNAPAAAGAGVTGAWRLAAVVEALALAALAACALVLLRGRRHAQVGGAHRGRAS
jgi:hypothetical protein